MEYKKLGDIATYINGYAFKPEQRGSEGLPIIRIQDLTGNAYDLGYYNGDYPKKVELNDGDVLISWSASLGVYLWNRGKALLNQHIFKVVFDKVEIDKFYFMYAVEYNLDKMSLKTHGATMKHITKKDFDNVVIPYPDLDYQKEISYRLTSLKGIIKKYQEQLVLLDELIKARFVEMFGDSITNDKNLKLISLFDLSVLKAGKSIKTGELSETYDDETLMYPCFGGNGIRGYINRYSHDGNYPVIGRQGAWAGNVNYATGKFYATEHAIVVTPKVDLNTVWYYYGLKYLDLTRFQTGAAQPGLAVDKLNKVFIPFPAIELQNQFASFVEEIDKSRLLSNHLLFLIKSISSNH
ncbi:restriction endonuclease subunit S [uncultured Catenibacterium sp.]|uniref:restriction endonuclease subunit S n=1 Tax=uncultured Catenibacterium sp. TaxID=286142 RepID=UPI0025ED6724|nr:restriction endonuclease subunit S [uncultured Catenibacterium sp.]